MREVNARNLASKAFTAFVCIVLACGVLLPVGAGSAWAEGGDGSDANPQATSDQTTATDINGASAADGDQQPSAEDDCGTASGADLQPADAALGAAVQSGADVEQDAATYAVAGNDAADTKDAALSDQEKIDRLLGTKWKGEYDGYANVVTVRRNIEIQLDSVEPDPATGNSVLYGIAIISPSDKELEGYGVNGSYRIAGEIDFETDQVYLQGYEWIDYPASFEPGKFSFVTFRGTVDFDSMTISGNTDRGIWEMTTYESNLYEFDSGFTLGVDNNSYAHWINAEGGNVGFNDVPPTYDISPESFKILKTYFNKGDINYLKERESGAKGWGGVCYGVAATMGLVGEGNLALSDITSSDATTYFDLPLPSDDPDLLNALNYYNLSQDAPHGGDSDASLGVAYEIGFFDSLENLITGKDLFESDSLSALLQTLVENPTHARLRMLCYATGSSGHTVLVTGCSYDAENGFYRVKLYDENTVEPGGYQEDKGAFSQMVIADDYSEFWILNENGDTLAYNSSFVELNLIDLDKLPSYTEPYRAKAKAAALAEADEAVDQSDSATIDVSLSRPFTITSAEGAKLVYDGKALSGDMEVRGADFSLYQVDSRLMLKVAPSASFIVEQAGNGIDASFTDAEGSHYYLKSDKATSANIDFGTGMTVSGTDYDFTAFASTSKVVDADESGLLSVSGSATGNVTLANDGEGVLLEGAGAGDLTIGSYEGGASYEKTVASAAGEYRFDHEIVVSADPIDPDEPTGPTDPEDPTDPDEPTDPDVPTDPSDPIGPTDPNDPADPDGSTDPNGSENPTDPDDNQGSLGDTEDPQDPSKDTGEDLKPLDTSDTENDADPALARTGDRIGLAGVAAALVGLSAGVVAIGAIARLRRNNGSREI